MSRNCSYSTGSMQLSPLAKTLLTAGSLLITAIAIFSLQYERLVLSLILFLVAFLGFSCLLFGARSTKNTRFDRNGANIKFHPDDKPLNPWDNLSASQDQSSRDR